MREYPYSSDATDLKTGDPVVYIGTVGKSLRTGYVIRRTAKGFTIGNQGDSQGIHRRFNQVAPLK